MIFEIRKSSDFDYRKTKEIKTIDDLLSFYKECGTNEIVIGRNRLYPDKSDNEYYIEIYDDWRE